ncbi:MAG: hypothetical protein AAGF19_00915 [Pseudomonadota bacterium]
MSNNPAPSSRNLSGCKPTLDGTAAIAEPLSGSEWTVRVRHSPSRALIAA